MPYRVLSTIIDLGPPTGEHASAVGVTYGYGEEVPDGVLTDAMRDRFLSVGAIKKIQAGDDDPVGEYAPPQPPDVTRSPVPPSTQFPKGEMVGDEVIGDEPGENASGRFRGGRSDRQR